MSAVDPSRPSLGVRSRRFAHWRHDWPWVCAVAVIALLAAAPVFSIAILAVTGQGDPWPHLAATVLPAALADTAMLLAGVAAVTILIGVTTAWLVTAYAFAGRRSLEWALLLPLAIPTYIIAYASVEILDYFGPVQSTLRAIFGWRSRHDYWFPEARSMPGAIILMGLVLYPYVYLTARAMFLMQSACVLDVARTLGSSRLGAFLQIALPLARPAVAIGVALALMEAMNDIGAVEYLGVRTLTVSIYTTWLARDSLSGAAQLALVALAVVSAIVWLERRARRSQRYAAQAQRQTRLVPVRLEGWRAGAALAVSLLPILLGFAAPALLLLDRALRRALRDGIPPGFANALANTVLLATIAASLAVALGLVIAYAVRITRTPGMGALARLASLGYAIPGTIFAVGMLAPLAAFDNALDDVMRRTLGVSTGLLLSGSGVALVLAYVGRYLAVACGGIEAGFEKVSPHLDMAARNLGRTSTETVREIHLPLLRPAIGAAVLLVFVDTMKELSATLLLRPFNFDTLATLVYEQASRGLFEEGALAALAIVAAGLGPVILLAGMSRPAEIIAGERGAASA
jgi:iron(III) transport system permease protein